MIPLPPPFKVRRWMGGHDTWHIATRHPLWDVFTPDGVRVATHESWRSAVADAVRRWRRASDAAHLAVSA